MVPLCYEKKITLNLLVYIVYKVIKGVYTQCYLISSVAILPILLPLDCLCTQQLFTVLKPVLRVEDLENPQHQCVIMCMHYMAAVNSSCACEST